MSRRKRWQRLSALLVILATIALLLAFGPILVHGRPVPTPSPAPSERVPSSRRVNAGYCQGFNGTNVYFGEPHVWINSPITIKAVRRLGGA